MKIVSLTLRGYHRLHLAQIDSISMTLTEKLQLILGTNGSGKSSLLKELSPLPPVSADYAKDGYKRIIIEHNSKIYDLTTQFGQPQPHSFKIDGEEQNDGGTMTVQKELVKREFNITPEIHDLMLGQTVFTKMGPNERRQWFTRLNNTNYNYAISVYQKLKEKYRDIAGAIKLNQTRAVQEANKLLSEDQQKQLNEEITEHRSFINKLLEMKSTSKPFDFENKQKSKSNLEKIKQFAIQIIKLRKDFLNLENFTSVEDIGEEITKCQIKINNLDFTIDLTSKEIENQQKIVDTLINANVSSFKDVDKKITEIHTELEKYRNLIQDVEQFENFEIAQQQLNAIFENLTIILTTIPVNREMQFSSENYQKLLNKQRELHQLKLEYENKRNKLLADKKYQEERKDSDAIECPKCLFNWKQGFNEKTYQQILLNLDSIASNINNVIEETNKVEVSIEETREYFNIYRSFQSVVSGSQHLFPFWNIVNEEKLIFKEPRSIIYRLEHLKHQFQEYEQVIRLRNELTSLTNINLLAKQNEATQVEKIKATIKDLDEKLYFQNKDIRVLKSRINTLKNYQKTASEIMLAGLQLEDLLENQDSIYDNAVQDLEQSLLNTLIRNTQLTLAVKEQQLSQINVQKALVESIQNNLSELEEEAKLTKILMEELSPTNGLIAKGSLNFIHSFTQQVNSFIKKIWLYPLEIEAALPDEDESLDLDYKFSVRINNARPIPDIKLASSAMSEIINLAFLVVSLKCLGLDNGWLALDEFARTFDSSHRQSAFNAITNLLTQSDFSQIFIVSHFESNYGSIRNAEIAVLCSKNIVIPPDSIVNKHVKFN